MAKTIKVARRVKDNVIFPWSVSLAARVTEFVVENITLVDDEPASDPTPDPAAATAPAVLPDEAMAMVELPEGFELEAADLAALAEMQQESEPDAEVAPVKRGPGRPRKSE